MQAVKGNKVYDVTTETKSSYLSQGFDIVNEAGTVLEYGKGKKVDYEEYAKVKAENEALKSQLGKRAGPKKVGE